MSSNFGSNLKISIFGQSHSEAIGIVIDGLPAGEEIDINHILEFMRRRAPGRTSVSTERKEADLPEILSGIIDGKTCGAPLSMIIRNTNTISSDYDDLKDIPRPGHADFTAAVKYNVFTDIRGGGHFSGRLTAPLCFAGAVCIQILKRKGIEVAAHVKSINNVWDDKIDSTDFNIKTIKSAAGKEIPVINDKSEIKMKDVILKAKENGDSVGGIIECFIIGMPVGVGEPMFDGIENHISSAVFAIPAVKGIEFGAGFEAARLLGSQNNDDFYFDENMQVKTKTNNHGGILGGISSGMPIVFSTAFKPTPSIASIQQSINLTKETEQELIIKGRHDPCIVPRAVPCIEAAAAIAILDLML